MFDLERSIEEWRCRLLASGVKAPVPLEELEEHLREEVGQQMRLGATGQDAFETATRHMGEAGVIEKEFKKVEKTKPLLRRKVAWILIGVALIGCWLEFGQSPAIALVYGIVLAGLVIASLIDFREFIIPDTITLGGILAGVFCSLLLPQLHGQRFPIAALGQSVLGVAVGAGILYFVLRTGKLAFGRERLAFAGDAKIVFTGGALLLPGKEIAYEELFFRKSDVITFHARTVEIEGHSYRDIPIRLTRNCLRIGEEEFNPEQVSRLEAMSSEVVLPREVMGFGDVKFMAAIGAFLGWQAVIFSLVASSLVGSLAGLGLIAAHRREWSSRLPYGPCIALGAAIWIFGGKQLVAMWFGK